MKTYWIVLPLTTLLFHCHQIERPSLPVQGAPVSAQVSPFFIVNEENVSSPAEAQSLCPATCDDQQASWTGTWSDRNPFPDTQGGVCECREKPLVTSSESDAPAAAIEVAKDPDVIYQMSEDEMKETFEVEATAKAGSSSATAKADAEGGGKAIAKAGDSVSKAESRPEVSATVHIDEESGRVTATATAGKAVARARTPPADGATTSINKQTGTVKACAQAGEARACAISK